jgi:hypothetical protein
LRSDLLSAEYTKKIFGFGKVRIRKGVFPVECNCLLFYFIFIFREISKICKCVVFFDANLHVLSNEIDLCRGDPIFMMKMKSTAML